MVYWLLLDAPIVFGRLMYSNNEIAKPYGDCVSWSIAISQPGGAFFRNVRVLVDHLFAVLEISTKDVLVIPKKL